jgi:hypothetical protein
MIRTVFGLGAAVLIGLVALKFLAAIVGGLLFFLIGLAVKILIIGAIVYIVLSIFSPDTLRRWRESWSAR